MRAADLALSLTETEDLPLFLQIAQAVVRDVARGRLRAGAALPGSRTLAASLGVHRSTVVAAYAELAAQGWLEARPGGATRVARLSPDVTPRRFAASAELRAGVPERTGFHVEPAPVRGFPVPELGPRAIALWGGLPDLRLLPPDLLARLARAYRRAATQPSRALLGYAREVRGQLRLRSALAELVSSSRGLAAGPESLLVTRGSQMALYLIARSLLAPGDVVAVEALGYPSAFGVFRRAGARLAPIAVDAQGIDVAALGALCQRERVRAVYVTPHHQYPTTVTLSAARRLALLDLARKQQLAIVEDDYDQEFHYDGRPVLPLASGDPHGNVIYVGTLAKILAPGLRLAFVVAPEPLLARLAHERALVDRQGDELVECAVAELLEDGDIQRHARRAKRIYQRRCDAFCAALDSELGGALDYQRPAGGLAIWVRAARGIDVEAWQRRALERDLHFQIGRHFSLTGGALPCIRLGFARLDERELPVAIRRLAESVPPRTRAGRTGRG